MTDRPDRDRRTDAERRMQEALGPDLASDAVGAAGAVTQPATSIRKPLILIILAIVALTVVSFVVSPPLGVNAEGHSRAVAVPFSYPADAIKANFELPAPHVVWPVGHHRPEGDRGLRRLDPVDPVHRLDRDGGDHRRRVRPVAVDPALADRAPERARVRLRGPRQLRDLARRPAGPPLRPALRDVLPVHPAEQLERAPAGRRPDRAAPGADLGREHDDRARPRQLLPVPHRGRPRASASAATSASSSTSAGSRTGSPRGSSACSSGSSSSSSSSSSRSRCRCDSSATSTPARSRSASSPA